MIALVFATRMEADPFLKLVQAIAVNKHLYSFSLTGARYLAAIIGVGRELAEKNCSALIAEHDVTMIINVGIAGGLDHTTRPGEIYTVDEVQAGDDVHHDSVPSITLTPWPGAETRTLVTVTKEVFNTERRDQLAKSGSLVDMEGLSIAKLCRERGITCIMLKGVSDTAGINGRDELKVHLAPVAAKLAETILVGLPSLARPTAGLAPGPAGAAIRLHRFTRLEHAVFSIPLLFAGAWLGSGGHPSLRQLFLIVLVGTGARTFGMAMNRILDRDLDARNPRTRQRELPSGQLSLKSGYLIAGTGLIIYLLGCGLLSKLCLYLSPLPVVPLALYSLLKRYTSLCHFGIGICLALAPLGAFVATADALPLHPDIIMLAGFTFLWISGFDIIYALLDLESDRKTGVHSLPVQLGSTGAQAVAAVCHMVAVVLLIKLWLSLGAGLIAGIALLIATAAFIAGYIPRLPLAVRFFPVSAIASTSGSLVILLRGLP